MKKSDIYFYTACMLISIAVSIACIPSEEKPLDDSFFVPVDTVRRQKSETKPVPVYIGQTSETDNDIKKEITDMLDKQNRRLDEIISRLTGAGNEKNPDSAVSSGINKTQKDPGRKITSEDLLEMVRQQGSKIDDAAGKIGLLSQNSKITGTKKENMFSEKPKVKQITVSPDSLSGGPVAGYAGAVRLYKDREYIKAIRAFQALLKEGIELRLQDNCHFWTGVCYFQLRRPERAINELQKVLNISGSDKNESACFMIGQCYEQMGTRKQARSMFNKMVRDYPEGDLRQIAEIKIALLR